MKSDSLDEFSDDQLSDLELKKLRRLLQQDDRAHWLWGFLTKVIVGVTMFAGFIAATKSYVIDAAKWLATK